MNTNGKVLPDLTKPSYEQLLAEVAQLKAKLTKVSSGPKMEWAKGHEGTAINMTWPGKRGRYLEVEELTYILENADSVLEDLTTLLGSIE